MTNTTKEVEDLLRSHGLRKTIIRVELLLLFYNNDFALSLGDIKAGLSVDYDRVTLYRALNSFLEHGILHVVPDSNFGLKYALCSDGCPHTAHQDVHAHFVCKKCHNTFCLENVKVPKIELSKGFSIDSYDYAITGTCEKCNKQ